MTLLVMIYALCRPQTKPKAEFVPPPFESEAQQGVPDVPEELDYSSPDRDDMSYDFAVCGKMCIFGGFVGIFNKIAKNV